jgi:hypothetical protein
MREKKNPFIVLFITAAMSAVMYCIAFHEMRNENKELKKQIEILKSKRLK